MLSCTVELPASKVCSLLRYIFPEHHNWPFNSCDLVNPANSYFNKQMSRMLYTAVAAQRHFHFQKSQGTLRVGQQRSQHEWQSGNGADKCGAESEVGKTAPERERVFNGIGKANASFSISSPFATLFKLPSSFLLPRLNFLLPMQLQFHVVSEQRREEKEKASPFQYS